MGFRDLGSLGFRSLGFGFGSLGFKEFREFRGLGGLGIYGVRGLGFHEV